ncbi:MAG: valine--tRNA ligase [Alphaproteobacteria bacterium]|nr:valine--tRNA ligase [Alphaproteobacteria bacterium]
MAQLPKQYDPKISEAHWQKKWEEMGVYAFRDDKPKAETFVIDTPPPTVSGILHMGHIFSYTQADFIARYKRMRGFDVFYPMGFDDNGLPTERLVEKIKNVRGSTMPRAEFVALCREVVKDAEAEFRKLFTGVALSVDWKLLYQTVSERVTALSQASFLDLVSKNECYRDFRPGYWDWVDQTAIATAEIENKDMQGVMVDLKFALENGGEITIATTRPELLGACVAVMYHPEDAHADKYKNTHAITPLFGVKVPMIADEAVDKEFGTGLVMCCTFGDDADKEWVRKYILPFRPILGVDGKISLKKCVLNEGVVFFADRDGEYGISDLVKANTVDINAAINAFTQLIGLKPKQAREKSIELLTAAGALVSKKDIVHSVKCAERSGTPIEIIPTSQWFVKLTDKKEALKAKGAEVVWHPQHMKIRLDQWIDGLKEDWCISRQRFFGVPFPVWYSRREGEEGKIIYADVSQLPIDPTTTPPAGYSMDEVTPDIDVMDTWATSSISPQINAHSLSAGKLFPADLRPQAHEIIRTWAFYTIAKAHLHSNVIPWKNIMISGWCLAADKTKMSKSKGNVVTPVALIDDKGADAVRYWASTSRLATDTAFSEDLLKIGKKLVGKIWNASNLIAQLPAASEQTPAKLEVLDRWILSRLHVAVSKATAAFEQFEYCDARVAIEDFFWNDFCDNYLELVKARAYNEGAGQASALYTLQTCLEAVLRLFAPFVPHVTEEIYSHLFPAKGSIHQRGMWPEALAFTHDEAAEKAGAAAVEILEVIRKAKSEANVSIKAPVARVEVFATDKATVTFAELAGIMDDLKAAGSVHEVARSTDGLLPYATRDGAYRIGVELAKVEDIKRNSDHAEHEKLEGKVLAAPGNPDMSKHIVKTQVQGLATQIERQR